MSKCECWRETPNRKWIDAVCAGTREQDACSCGGDKMKCDFYPEIREKAQIQAAIAYYNRGINEDIFSRETAAYANLAVQALREKDGFWHSAKEDPPEENGRYLVYYRPFGNGVTQVLTYTLDLGEACPIDFEGDHRPGWYEYDSEWGFVECNNVIYWAEVPKAPCE